MKRKPLFILLVTVVAILAASFAAGCTGKAPEGISVVLIEGEQFHVPGTSYSFILMDASVLYKGYGRAVIDVYQGDQYIERLYFDNYSGPKEAAISGTGIEFISAGDKSAVFFIYNKPG
jgi:hypothetical protein